MLKTESVNKEKETQARRHQLPARMDIIRRDRRDRYRSFFHSSERTVVSYVSWWRRGERLVHAALDGQFDVVSVHAGLLGMCGVDFGVLYDGRHISCEQKQTAA